MPAVISANEDKMIASLVWATRPASGQHRLLVGAQLAAPRTR